MHWISIISGLADPVAASLSSDCERSRLKTYSYGAALIAGGTKDTVADYIGNNRFRGRKFINNFTKYLPPGYQQTP